MSSNKTEKGSSTDGGKPKQKPLSNNNNNNSNDDDDDDTDIKTGLELDNKMNGKNPFGEFKVIENGNGIVDASRSLTACLKYYCAGGFGRPGTEIADNTFETMKKYIKEAAEPSQKRRKRNNNNNFNSIVSYSIITFVFSFVVLWLSCLLFLQVF